MKLECTREVRIVLNKTEAEKVLDALERVESLPANNQRLIKELQDYLIGFIN